MISRSEILCRIKWRVEQLEAHIVGERAFLKFTIFVGIFDQPESSMTISISEAALERGTLDLSIVERFQSLFVNNAMEAVRQAETKQSGVRQDN